jgi:hypothetical protein
MFEWGPALLPALRTLGRPQDGEWELPAGSYDRAVHEWHELAAKPIRVLDLLLGLEVRLRRIIRRRRRP